MELGSVYARLGSKVTVVEFLDSLIPTMDGTMGKELLKLAKKNGHGCLPGSQGDFC